MIVVRALLPALLLSGCAAIPAGIVVAGSGLAGIRAAYEFATDVSSDASEGIEVACRALVAKEAALEAQGKQDVVAATESWSGATAFCDPKNPPPKSPIAAAVWLGIVVGKM